MASIGIGVDILAPQEYAKDAMSRSRESLSIRNPIRHDLIRVDCGMGSSPEFRASPHFALVISLREDLDF